MTRRFPGYMTVAQGHTELLAHGLSHSEANYALKGFTRRYFNRRISKGRKGIACIRDEDWEQAFQEAMAKRTEQALCNHEGVEWGQNCPTCGLRYFKGIDLEKGYNWADVETHPLRAGKTSGSKPTASSPHYVIRGNGIHKVVFDEAPKNTGTQIHQTIEAMVRKKP